MNHSRTPPRASTAITAITAVVTASAVVLAGTAPAHAAGPATPAAHTTAVTAESSGTASGATAPSIRFVTISGHGGTKLAANVVAPGGRDGGRRLPLVVLPTSWSVPQVEYLVQAQKLASAGYVVVSYNSRGFWQSGGRIEVAGPRDVADASKVIDWALRHTPADPRKIGMAGISYGAGISLLASAFDRRIKAVVAMSGWADLVDSIYSGRTQHSQASALLVGSGYLTGRPSADLQRYMEAFFTSDLSRESEMIAWGRKRSPSTYVSRINANGAAIMLGNAWGDSIFPPNQYADFYDRLTVPKRLELRPGDHATPEATGLLGLPNDVWRNCRRWLDHHLKGADNGIDREQPVRLTPRTGGRGEGYPSWRAVPSGTRKIPLAGTRRISAGLDSGANGGLIFLSSALDQFAKAPPEVAVPLLPRAHTAVWQSRPYPGRQRVRGTVTLRTTVTSTRARGTVIAHLYDVGPLGRGKLITHAPFTFHGKRPGRPFPVHLELFSTAYDVPAGHRLALVVDTVDSLYIEHNPDGARLTFSSPAGNPSYVSVPLRRP
ncbi:hypothetical protein GCM10010156_46070 [Planobispora rosea]|uniref:Xaa-Pro dipeptidyl-peptidase C-terminal domain-containing protein n=1 Tax=Planobispora rosea TaxID=35762 RepID=A0A8J3WE78_PLARO|nr:alpha/beta fold hydrolase [Planobispora rosea]GGS82120.1 hypothetical protein GCM10010156_46070 [Planobispora rosea]GIH86060.1 hypothetical protein Pro02_44680 [Planobispora rosea]